MTDYPRPRVENAPGLTWKNRENHWEARWHARTDLIKAGYEPKSMRLWIGVELADIDAAYISDQCRRLQDEMLIFGRGGIEPLPAPVPVFDGSLRMLIDAYQDDPDSAFHKIRYRTRGNYRRMCRQLARDHGNTMLADIKGRTVLRWYEDWTAAGKMAMAHGLIAMLRMVVNFGVTMLEDAECERLSGVLSKMKFSQPKARISVLTADQAIAVRAKAHEMGLPSIALAQAFQFDGTLRQRDVIGEWVPQSEPGMSVELDGAEKWLRGLLWSEIDGNLILRHVTSKKQKEVEIDLRLAPMVLEELKLAYGLDLTQDLDRSKLPANGPVIRYEMTNLPYRDQRFRVRWRQVATAAGVPSNVRNMDSRAGAITEATHAGAALEDIRHAAAHGDIQMTARYARGSAEKTAKVMVLRAAHRNKPRT